MGASPEQATPEDELRPEYNFRTMRGVVRGKYAARYQERLRVVRLADDVAAAFADEAAVNAALREYLRGRSTENMIRLGFTQEETAYHEAGHAAIAMIYGFTPELIFINKLDELRSGGCILCASLMPEHAVWRGQMAIAGVLAQALWIAGRHLRSDKVIIPPPAVEDLVEFFFAAPTPTRTCVVCLKASDGNQTCQVDICGTYSTEDYLHFRPAVAMLTEQRLPGKQFSGNEEDCRVTAQQCVSRCVTYLNNPSVWKHLASLAEALLGSVPVTAHLLHRQGIEKAAMGLSQYKQAFS